MWHLYANADVIWVVCLQKDFNVGYAISKNT